MVLVLLTNVSLQVSSVRLTGNPCPSQEVENYRSAMNKMAEDIIELRTQLLMVEAENSRLRSDLSLHQHLGRDLQGDTDVDVMTKAEISDHIGKPQQSTLLIGSNIHSLVSSLETSLS